MPQTCTVCRHENRAEIDHALVAGEPFRNIAARFGTSAAALFRHKQRDLPCSLVKAKEAADEVQAETLFERLRALNRETTGILKAARAAQNHAIALHAIARAEKQLELEARLLGELNDSAKVAIGINVNPQPDLSVLTDDELKHLEALALKVRAQPQRM
jgi:hypothetical protein